MPEANPHTSRASWLHVAALILGVLTLRLIYLAWFCPYDPVEDEAHYWEWSRRLGLSYYSKGPGIAWAIAAGTAIFGDNPLGIRAPAALAHAIGMSACAALAAQLAKRHNQHTDQHQSTQVSPASAALFAAAIYALIPAFQVLAILSTIDGPMLALWTTASLAAYHALRNASRSAWIAIAIAVGAATLFKYTALLFPVGIIAWLILYRKHANLCKQPARWIAAAAFTLLIAISPIIIWNHEQGWPTLAHLLGHLGAPGGDYPTAPTSPDNPGPSYSPFWTIEYIAMQLGMIGPACALVLIAAIKSRKSPAPVRADAALMLAIALPVLILYLAVSFVTRIEGNWPIAAYPTLLALAAPTTILALRQRKQALSDWKKLPKDQRPRAGILSKRPENLTQIAWHWTLGVGIISGIGMLRADLIAHIPILGKTIPVGRFTSAQPMAEHAAQILEQLKQQTNLEPFIIAQHYGRASTLALMIPDHPPTYSSSSLMGGRATQYDYFKDTQLNDPALLGRPALLIGADHHQWSQAFQTIKPINPKTPLETKTPLTGDHKLDSNNNPTRPAYIGLNYKGFPQRPIKPPTTTKEQAP